MVKVIERKERKLPRYRFSCDYCGSVLECDENDLESPMSLGRATVICPVCAQITHVQESDRFFDED